MNSISKIDAAGRLSRQWHGYASTHRVRSNLVVHAATVPIFMAGTCAVLAAPWAGILWSMVGPVAMAVAMAAQGYAHRGERERPAPFRGGADILIRILVEQWITFPRYLLSGAFWRAWREGGR